MGNSRPPAHLQRRAKTQSQIIWGAFLILACTPMAVVFLLFGLNIVGLACVAGVVAGLVALIRGIAAHNRGGKR